MTKAEQLLQGMFNESQDPVSDFWKTYDKEGRKYDKRYGAARQEMTNAALSKVMSKVSQPAMENPLPPNVRITSVDERLDKATPMQLRAAEIANKLHSATGDKMSASREKEYPCVRQRDLRDAKNSIDHAKKVRNDPKASQKVKKGYHIVGALDGADPDHVKKVLSADRNYIKNTLYTWNRLKRGKAAPNSYSSNIAKAGVIPEFKKFAKRTLKQYNRKNEATATISKAESLLQSMFSVDEVSKEWVQKKVDQADKRMTRKGYFQSTDKFLTNAVKHYAKKQNIEDMAQDRVDDGRWERPRVINEAVSDLYRWMNEYQSEVDEGVLQHLHPRNLTVKGRSRTRAINRYQQAQKDKETLKDWGDDTPEDKYYRKRAREFNSPGNNQGVQIVASPTVTNKETVKSPIVRKVKSFVQSKTYPKHVDKVLDAARRRYGTDDGATISALGRGRYNDGKKTHKERSFTTDIAGVSQKDGERIGKAIARSLGKQDSAVVRPLQRGDLVEPNYKK